MKSAAERRTGAVNGVDRRLIVHTDADPVFVEQYRRLGAALHRARVAHGIGAVMVTSAAAGEGKTLSATNLALTLSRSFKQRVLLVDGDLRKPSIHQLLQIENGIGLSGVLKEPGSQLPLQTWSPMLDVITGGESDSDPVPLLVSAAWQRFLADARDRFDWVLVDTPPLVLFPDAELFAERVDSCVFVVDVEKTTSPAAASAVAALGASRILGVVLNRAELSEVAAGYGYAYGEYGTPEHAGHAASRRPTES